MTPEERMREATEAEALKARAELQDAIDKFEAEPNKWGRMLDVYAAKDHVNLLDAITKREEELDLLEEQDPSGSWSSTRETRRTKKYRLRTARLRAETLTWLNEMREGLGLPALSRLPVGFTGNTQDCVVARGLKNGWAISTGANNSDLVFEDGRSQSIDHPSYVSSFIGRFDENEPETGMADLSIEWLADQEILTPDEYDAVAWGVEDKDSGEKKKLSEEQMNLIIDLAWERYDKERAQAATA